MWNKFSCVIDDAQEWRYYGQYDTPDPKMICLLMN